MCGRCVLTINRQQLARWTKSTVRDQPTGDTSEEHPHLAEDTADYNVSPGTMLPVIWEENGERMVQNMKWGLVPSFTKQGEGHTVAYKMINARCETVDTRNAYRYVLRNGDHELF